MNLNRRSKLLEAIRARPESHNATVEALMAQAQDNAKLPDWLWHLLVCSMSTMGNSRGFKGVIENQVNYNLIAYPTLVNLAPEARYSNMLQALTSGKVRMPGPKATWLEHNFTFLQDCGGVEAMQKTLLEVKGRDSKIRLMRVFHGIGDKYARNIFMDIYHADFIDSIAVDERLAAILDALEVAPRLNYARKENILKELASDACIMPWYLDRLLYSYKEHYCKMALLH